MNCKVLATSLTVKGNTHYSNLDFTHLFITKSSQSLHSSMPDRQWYPPLSPCLLSEVAGQCGERLWRPCVSEAINQNGVQLRVIGVGEGGGKGSLAFCECSGLGWNT